MPELFEHWHDYYLVQGGVAGTLVALLFVAASVGIDYLTSERLTEARAFMNPVVVHFTAVLVTASLALAPLQTPLLFVFVVGAGAVAGVVYSTVATLRVVRLTKDRTDRLCYGMIPGLGYVVIVAAMGMIWAHVEAGPEVLAGALLVLLVVNIRNAWDLTVDLVRRHSDHKK
jgi:hypothetical protein